MSASAILLALARFAVWETALFAAAIRIAEWLGWRADRREERWLAVLAIEVTLEASLAGLFSFTRWNSPAVYWMSAALCLAISIRHLRRPKWQAVGVKHAALMTALLTPLMLLAFKPVEEIDSINYLHYLIDWMGNRATPYTFATNYVAFWELSFLPAWMVTGVDLFFPLLALKALLLLALAAWLAGREFSLGGPLLVWTVFGSLVMRHFWFEYSGVPTLKNDALHGAGFVLLALVVMRAAHGSIASTDAALLALGVAFASVKYTGIFAAAIAVAAVILLARPPVRWLLAAAAFFLVTAGHYYVNNLLRYGSPFYPFQINIAFLHLPGTADLSNTSILFSLHDPRVWRLLFLPEGGVSPAGLLFPVILAVVLVAATVRCLCAIWLRIARKRALAPLDFAAGMLLAGWMLYFRSVFSASAYAGDLAFLRNSLNTIRYVDGVLALSEVFLVALLAKFYRVAWLLVAINAASRLVALYIKLPAALFPRVIVCAIAVSLFGLLLLLHRRAWIIAFVILIVACPVIVERNRLLWTTYWNDLKPLLQDSASNNMAILGLPDGGYFAGQIVAAGNPVHTSVRTVLAEEMDALPLAKRPHTLAVLVTPGSEAASAWRSRYNTELVKWGYTPLVEGKYGAILQRK
jgi:hypothetical protein